MVEKGSCSALVATNWGSWVKKKLLYISSRKKVLACQELDASQTVQSVHGNDRYGCQCTFIDCCHSHAHCNVHTSIEKYRSVPKIPVVHPKSITFHPCSPHLSLFLAVESIPLRMHAKEMCFKSNEMSFPSRAPCEAMSAVSFKCGRCIRAEQLCSTSWCSAESLPGRLPLYIIAHGSLEMTWLGRTPGGHRSQPKEQSKKNTQLDLYW